MLGLEAQPPGRFWKGGGSRKGTLVGIDVICGVQAVAGFGPGFGDLGIGDWGLGFGGKPMSNPKCGHPGIRAFKVKNSKSKI